MFSMYVLSDICISNSLQCLSCEQKPKYFYKIEHKYSLESILEFHNKHPFVCNSLRKLSQNWISDLVSASM